MSRHLPMANLLPLLEVHETHFVTMDGSVGVVLAANGLNLRIMSADTAQATIDAFAHVLNFLESHVHMQLLAVNKPLRGEEWLPRHLKQYRAGPPEMRGYVRGLAEHYRAEFAGRHVPDLRYYIVLSVPIPEHGGRSIHRRLSRQLRRSPVLRRDREIYNKTVGELERTSQGVINSFAAMGVHAVPLGRQGMVDLLWRTVNPEWGEDLPAPDPDMADSVTRYELEVGQDGRREHPATLNRLRELLAQSRLVRGAEHLRLDGAYERTVALRCLPDSTLAGWLGNLMATGVQFRFSLHIRSLGKKEEHAKLKRKLNMLHAVVTERTHKGLAPDIDQEERYEEMQGVLRDLATTDMRTFRVAAFITVRARTPDMLKVATRDVARALNDAGGTSIDKCMMHQLAAWQATLPLGYNPAEFTFRVTGTNLADTMPFLHHRAGTHGGVLIGLSDPSREVATLDIFHRDFPNHNAICLGMSGSGKTMFAQSFSLKHVAKGHKVVVLDRSNGHWDDLVGAVPGAAVHPVLLDSGLRINPWDLEGESGRNEAGIVPHSKIEYLLGLHTLMIGTPNRDGVLTLGAEEMGTLEGAIRAVYEGTPRPQERDLHDYLHGRGDDFHGGLAKRLAPYVRGGVYAGLLDGPTTLRPDAPLEVFNFYRLPESVVPLAMMLLIEYLWSVIYRTGQRTLVVMDEGWSLLNQPASARFVAEATRRGRHHGIATLNMSQSVQDYLGELGRAVINNASVSLLLSQSAHALPVVQQVFRLTDDEAGLLARLKTHKRVGAGAYLFSREGADSGSLQLYVTPIEYWLFTSDRAERELRQEAIERHAGDVWAAVTELARTGGRLDPSEASRPNLAFVE